MPWTTFSVAEGGRRPASSPHKPRTGFTADPNLVSVSHASSYIYVADLAPRDPRETERNRALKIVQKTSDSSGLGRNAAVSSCGVLLGVRRNKRAEYIPKQMINSKPECPVRAKQPHRRLVDRPNKIGLSLTSAQLGIEGNRNVFEQESPKRWVGNMPFKVVRPTSRSLWGPVPCHNCRGTVTEG